MVVADLKLKASSKYPVDKHKSSKQNQIIKYAENGVHYTTIVYLKGETCKQFL